MSGCRSADQISTGHPNFGRFLHDRAVPVSHFQIAALTQSHTQHVCTLDQQAVEESYSEPTYICHFTPGAGCNTMTDLHLYTAK